MDDLTPERARKSGKRWMLAAFAVIAVQIPLDLVGLDMFGLPLNLFVFVCAFWSGERSGWADGWKAAKADDSGNLKVLSCADTETPTDK